ncbi:uncharacterized protein TNIN_315061 [Trichonephila inaurata madagascariensis]|uniref:Uncharacterized protein n=1 Tax=Trichonephila inaurata madagascariensis TaxID=2747483 RepID=A0A8X6XVC3_9ARAC|nr:uncharacterized protein TNIN_315061 [Trichonephila inaurata madagascariensis]
MTNLRNLVDTSEEVLRGLKALGTEATNRDPCLMQKLGTETKKVWSVKTTEKDFPTLKEFLSVGCSSLKLITCNDFDTRVPTKSNFIACKNNPGSRTDKNCLKCSGVHKLFRCMKFENMVLLAKKNFIKRNYPCFLCLNSQKLKDCPNNLKCSFCQGKHDYLLHEDSNRNGAFLLNVGAN